MIDVNAVKGAATDRWTEILTNVAGIPPEVLDGRHHPCPKCGGTDRFRLLDRSKGALLCNQCFSKRNGDGIAAVQWLRNVSFQKALIEIGGFLRLSAPGNDSSNIIEQYCRLKRIPSNSFIRFGAKIATRDGAAVARVPMYGPNGATCSHCDFGLSGQLSKGLNAKGKPSGLYFPQGDTGDVKLPRAGETWLLTEGVKDAAALLEMGYLAAGIPTHTLAEKFAPLFTDVNCILVPDLDEAGQSGAEETQSRLIQFAKWIGMARLPGTVKRSDGADVRDVLAREGGESLVRQAIEDARKRALRQTNKFTPNLICMADVEPREVDWLWFQRVAAGRITLLVGLPGEGKSFLTCDMAARVSTGRDWPDGCRNRSGSVILITAEDDPGDTIRPRLDALSADVLQIHLLRSLSRIDGDGVSREILFSLRDVEQLEVAIQRAGNCKLVIVDPIGSFLGGKTDAHRDNEVRSELAPLAAVAESHGVAVVIVAHRRKSRSGSADDSALGSRAFTGIARATWHLSRDPNDKSRRLLLPGKNNLADAHSGLAFRIGGIPPRIEWEPDPIGMHADDVIGDRVADGGGKYSACLALKEAESGISLALSWAPICLLVSSFTNPRCSSDCRGQTSSSLAQ
jgi:putative DNA primase/helicase